MSTEDAGDAVVLLSGGMDSATVLYEAIERGYTIHVLHAMYGQETDWLERKKAIQLAWEVDVHSFEVLELDPIDDIGCSSLTTDQEIDASDPNEESIPDTYVPFRNGALLSFATAYAEANDCEAIFIGAHSEDFSGYPDCRPTFFSFFQDAISTGTKPETNIELLTPFVDCTKTEILEHGRSLDVPYELTWSCYRSVDRACGECEACQLRLEAFENVGIEDPIEYESDGASLE